MCGIAGIIGQTGVGDLQRCTQISENLRHRGPDDAGTWQWRSEAGFGATFVHRRLAIIDLRSLAAQPMISPSSGAAIVFNGEIYNFRELRFQLKAAGAQFLTNGDTEVILKGYETWGAQIFSMLRGMFAIAIFDPARQCAFLARDGYGIKPLYWTSIPREGGGTSIAFASETRALVNAGLARRKTDLARVGRYLWNGFMPGPETIWTDINEVPRGSVCRIDANSEALECEHFWSPSKPFRTSTRITLDDAREAIAQSVAAHLAADVPKVAFLSGGVDSTAVSALACRAQGKLATLSIGFEEVEADESLFAYKAARAIGSQHTAIRLVPADILSSMDAAVSSLDQPSFDAINTWFVSREAVQSGFKVALAGTGGDELLGGYASFRRAELADRMMRLTGSSPAFGLLGSALGRIKPSSKARELGAGWGDWVKLYQAQYALFDSNTISKMLCDPEATSPWGLSKQRLHDLQGAVCGLGPLEAVSALESELFLGDRLLRDTDSVSMSHSLEVRLPLVDATLANVLGGMDPKERFCPVGEKRLLRQQVGTVLPESFFSRPKRGSEFPMDAWMRGPLRRMLEEVLLDPSACYRIGLHGAAVARVWERFRDHPGSLYWTRPWAIFALLRWAVDNEVTC